MKNISLLIFFLVCFIKINAQEKKEINAGKLIDIVEKGDFTNLVKLVSSLHYIVLDSSKEKDGSLFYYAKEPKIKGSVLACSADSKKKITELTYNTFSKEEWKELKSQLNKIGFKSSGIHRGKSDVVESEDFEKGEILVATAIRKDKGGDVFYEFTFIKF